MTKQKFLSESQKDYYEAYDKSHYCIKFIIDYHPGMTLRKYILSTKLTLKQIRKLRKMLDVRNYEHVKNLKKVRKQYTPVAPETPGL